MELGLSNFHYNLHRDSLSSLAWTQADKANSSLARWGNIVFTTLSMHLDAHVAILTHIPKHTLLDPSMEFNADQDPSIIMYLRLCDPDDLLDDITAHTTLLKQRQQLLVS